jgi:1,4-alpha-glucan branching enzyme
MNRDELSDFDLYLIAEGTHHRVYEKLGAHPGSQGDVKGTHFRVWAPNAGRVSVVGDFNGWNRDATPMQVHHNSGIWHCFVPGVGTGGLYKYFVESRFNGHSMEKADPFAYAAEIRPQTASKVWDLSQYEWNDEEWMNARHNRFLQEEAMSIYEVHLGSWMRVPEENHRWLSYREIAHELLEYVRHMGFTHVELLPVSEHPFDGSWGYQTVGYFAPTSRFGTPDDFMYFVDTLHQSGIGIILDWVPAHFPGDGHGLGYFDGTHLYEHAHDLQRIHPDWNTLVFNYGRKEVQNFLISNALFWLDRYHIDGLRVDAVASMLYLDYGRKEGEWIPNRYGGKENLEAVDFLKRLNECIHAEVPGVTVIAEESTAWPMVSRPTYLGGLGFGFKWNMGWMHDMLEYMSHDPVHRSYHHHKVTFSLMYAFAENFVLPFSHDEVVYGKGSLIGKMPGDEWQKFANLRALYGYMFGHPGKKLLFMGCEFGQWNEWHHDGSLDWDLLSQPRHSGLQRWVRDLNTLYRSDPALFELDSENGGFEWIDCNDSQRSLISFMRYGRDRKRPVVFVCNFTPVVRHDCGVGVPFGGTWKEALNSDAPLYGGSGQGNLGAIHATSLPMHGQSQSLNITVPPLSALIFQRDQS